MDLLAAGYGSESDRDDEVVHQECIPKSAAIKISRNQVSNDLDDDTEETSDESVDSAEQRALEAAARLRDYGETATSGRSSLQGGLRQGAQNHQASKSVLPSALDVLDKVEGPPTFLDPEAIRPLATAALHGLSDEQTALLGGPSGRGAGGPGERQQPGKDFDISRLAPPLKGQAKQSTDKRGAPPGAVIEGKAKRYKPEDGPEATQQYTAAQIAMMGGKVDDRPHGRGPTTPMEVSEFLNKGLGAAQLPRRNQDRKDKEKQKRMKGQSTHSHWKSEAEMVLRQQFDS